MSIRRLESCHRVFIPKQPARSLTTAMPPKGKKSKLDLLLCHFCDERPREAPFGSYMSPEHMYETKGACAYAPWCKNPESLYQCGWCEHWNVKDTLCGCLREERPMKVTQVLAHFGFCEFCSEMEKMEDSKYCYECHSDLYQSQWKLYAYPPN